MIVDDHAAFRRILREFLPSDSAPIREFENGAMAVEAYHNERPDLVLMDLSMPVMDGMQATTEILRRDPSACIVMITHHDDEVTRDASRNCGASAFLSKGDLSQLPELLEVIS